VNKAKTIITWLLFIGAILAVAMMFAVEIVKNKTWLKYKSKQQVYDHDT